jgi:hypothetical protein
MGGAGVSTFIYCSVGESPTGAMGAILDFSARDNLRSMEIDAAVKKSKSHAFVFGSMDASNRESWLPHEANHAALYGDTTADFGI